MSNVTKSHLITSIADRARITQVKAAEVLGILIDEITEEVLYQDRAVVIAGFGKFSASKRAEHTGRNPITGLDVHVPAKKRLHFKPSPKLAQEI